MPRYTEAQYQAMKANLEDKPTAFEIQRSLQKNNTSAPRKSKRKTDEPEDLIFDTVATYCDIKGHQYIHIPDEIYALMADPRTPQHVKAAITKWLAGIPDLIIFKKEKFSRSIDCIDASALIMELKTETGKIRQRQKQWARGLVVHYPRSSKAALDLIRAWE